MKTLHRWQWHFFPIWDISEPDIVAFFAEQVNLHHPTMKFTAEISENETFFSETVVYQGTTFNERWEKAILDVKTHFKPKPYSIYIFTSYHPPFFNWKRLLHKREALRILRTNSSEDYVFQISKALDGQRVATQFWKKNCY